MGAGGIVVTVFVTRETGRGVLVIVGKGWPDGLVEDADG